MVEQPIKVSGFGGNACFTLEYINIDLVIGPITFYMLGYFIIYFLGDSRSRKLELCPLHTNNVLKAIWRRNKVHMNSPESLS